MTRRAAPLPLAAVHARILSCRACPRLVAWREEVGRAKRRAYRDETYWARPVPGFGDPKARLLIVGLAPGAHGANRTGRVFTGDRSGDFLYAALHRAGYASQATATARQDGLALTDAFITLPVRCVPPGNAPSADELARCAPHLDAELARLTAVRVILALGAIAWGAVLAHLRRAPERAEDRPPAGVPFPFAHGAELDLGRITVLGSYHVSQQNTQTGRLTPRMFDATLARARRASTRPDGPTRGRAGGAGVIFESRVTSKDEKK